MTAEQAKGLVMSSDRYAFAVNAARRVSCLSFTNKGELLQTITAVTHDCEKTHYLVRMWHGDCGCDVYAFPKKQTITAYEAIKIMAHRWGDNFDELLVKMNP